LKTEKVAPYHHYLLRSVQKAIRQLSAQDPRCLVMSCGPPFLPKRPWQKQCVDAGREPTFSGSPSEQSSTTGRESRAVFAWTLDYFRPIARCFGLGEESASGATTYPQPIAKFARELYTRPTGWILELNITAYVAHDKIDEQGQILP